MRFFHGVLKLPSQHNDVSSLGARERRRMYQHLLTLMDEESHVKELLHLPVEPRLSVVDEERVTILRPRDRAGVVDDPQMRNAQKRHRQQEDKGWEQT
jgi:hypothetical protein